ncbi:uncharacterized protein EV154DRAFT_488919 [Mucor mucedo]|uniref:uncharacterized protein n=1 Tax=Mucor mucedo TaxID=29922 RepID=UPI00221FD410|nr:uncharacterized protein EV154DRAFT_488919 [Mucor mucedo]KAI7864309.1 hypothetical protein EV154DRAFT_488919 [Mucor mucedo]
MFPVHRYCNYYKLIRRSLCLVKICTEIVKKSHVVIHALGVITFLRVRVWFITVSVHVLPICKFIAPFVSLPIHFYILIKAALPSTTTVTDIPLTLDIVNQRFINTRYKARTVTTRLIAVSVKRLGKNVKFHSVDNSVFGSKYYSVCPVGLSALDIRQLYINEKSKQKKPSML